MASQLPPLALTAGDPAGIGPDITLAAWAARRAGAIPEFFVLGDPEVLAARARALGLDIRLEVAERLSGVGAFDEALTVVPVAAAAPVVAGRPDPRNGAAIIEAIRRGVSEIAAGRASAIVTNPISKKTLYDTGFAYPGHTEFLAAIASEMDGASHVPVMMLAGPDLRTVPVTVHIPLAEVTTRLTTELIVETGRIVARDLARRFGIAAPRLAIAGLNPHAGESGAIGDEEERVIGPAVAALRTAGIAARGPLPADTMFHAAARAGYDAALCMYHDQALIPVKTLAFDRTVNATLGLPFVRTSPDHGTAFDIAGSGKADPASLIEALRLARSLAAADARR